MTGRKVKGKEKIPANQKTLSSFFGKRIIEEKFVNFSQLQMLELKIKLAIDLRTANGLDNIIPGSSSSSSSTANPSNTSSNINVTVEGNDHERIEVNTTQVTTASVSSSSTSTSALINVSATLSRKCNAFCPNYMN